jgi:hypothetical protein
MLTISYHSIFSKIDVHLRTNGVCCETETTKTCSFPDCEACLRPQPRQEVGHEPAVWSSAFDFGR